MLRLAMVAGLALGGCVSAIKANRIPADLTPQMEKQALMLLSDRVRDPGSLQLSKLEAGKKDDGSVIVCGFYNAKNGFGGYAGRTPFFMLLPITGEPAIGWEPSASALIHARCAASGLSLT